MSKGINRKNITLTYDDTNFFRFPSEILLDTKRSVKNQSHLRTDEDMEERKKCASNKKLIWS